MKQKLLLIILAIVFAVPAFAQKDSKKCEARLQEMQEFRMKFLADEIDLRDNQKKQFFEVYNQMTAERRAAFRKLKKAEKSIADNKDASEADYDRATKEMAEAKAEMVKIEQKYDEKFATFLTKKQLYKLKEAECKFFETMKNCRDKKKTKKK